MRPGYADAWELYADAGWTPVPLPRRKKKSPPRGTTGDTDYRYDPGRRDYLEWADRTPRGNLAIVMPPTCIGLDVDVRHGGHITLARLRAQYGSLPTTWESTSRSDGSGIALFRVPPGTKLVAEIETGIEVCQSHHRYVVCWPSIHPLGPVYQWYVGDTVVDVPLLREIPDLPRAWLRGLADTRAKVTEASGFDGDTSDWLDEHSGDRITVQARRVLREAGKSFDRGACRHGTMCSAQVALVRIGAAGRPVTAALEELEVLFTAALYAEDDRDPEDEFREALVSAVRKYGGAQPPKGYPGMSGTELDASARRIARRLEHGE